MSTMAPPLGLAASGKRGFYETLNTRLHRRALFWFMAVVLAGGALGYYFPWLVDSDVLHSVYALLVLIGLILLRKGFTGTARVWWNISLVIQIASVIQTLVPRIELPLFYNAIVFIPMGIGIYYHVFPSELDAGRSPCTCSRH